MVHQSTQVDRSYDFLREFLTKAAATLYFVLFIVLLGVSLALSPQTMLILVLFLCTSVRFDSIRFGSVWFGSVSFGFSSHQVCGKIYERLNA